MKIKSKTDVITNSSSEVFIIHKNLIPEWTEKGQNSNCIDVYPLTMKFLDSEPETICDLMKWDYAAVGGKLITSRYGSYWDFDNDDWLAWQVDHMDEITEKIKDLYWVDIEDHYDCASYEADTSEAKDICIWYDYRH